MKTVGILDLLSDTALDGRAERLYAHFFRKQFTSITPQFVAAWCRRLGHRVHYATYYGQRDPCRLLPDDIDVLFVSAYTQVSALAYAVATLYRRRGTLTVIGGPHARSFPSDCLRFFDIAVKECDQTLIDDILRGRFDPPAIVASGRALTSMPTVEERLPEIVTASFHRGRPTATSVVPMLSSVGCPYDCDFCVDWNSKYVTLPPEQLRADLDFVSLRWPKALVGYHDPNFAVRFDETMDIIESLPEGRRNPYIMESSLSILKDSRLPRLSRTNCLYIAPGIESWSDYSNKSGATGKAGTEKVAQVVAHLDRIARHVPGLQANILFGGDTDSGEEPAALTIDFIERSPHVWPTINIPTPFGGTPMYDNLYRSGRILEQMPFAFYYNPYLAIVPKHYDPERYYDHLIAIHEAITSGRMLWRRLRSGRPIVRFIHGLRTLATRAELGAFRHIRDRLRSDMQFRAFHEGRSHTLPEFYHQALERRLGRYASLLPRGARVPVLERPRARHEARVKSA
jgi:radical SAM superfamily enzyme YgiQ (UPF0313 family)